MLYNVMNKIKEKAGAFLNLLKSSKNAVVFTGAGISTESGIPDYRSPGIGLWENMDQTVVSLNGFLDHPDRYYNFALKLHSVRSSAKPNYAHFMLSQFESEGLINGIITQNVDGLHYEAGSVNVYELHGSLRQVICLDCGLVQPINGVMERVGRGENPPLCENCNGVLKPNAVFFGENLPSIPWEKALQLTNSSDLFISIGSSLRVSPANTLPNVVIRNKARLIIINLMNTPYDSKASLVIRQKIAEFAKIVLDLHS